MQAMFLESQSQVDAVKARLDKGENFADIAAELSLEKTSKDNKGDFGWVPPEDDLYEAISSIKGMAIQPSVTMHWKIMFSPPIPLLKVYLR